MDLILHCGCHKTGTTSFQALCRTHRDLLAELGLHYPLFGQHDQHSPLLWQARREGWHVLARFLGDAREAAGTSAAVLLSGEDFENCIVDLAQARRVADLAHGAGFDRVRWVVVTRDPLDYAASLYAEMCKHGVVLQYDVVMRAATERGCLHVSAQDHDYIFALDYARFAEDFRHAAGDVTEIRMQDFVTPFPGAILLKAVLPLERYARFARESAPADGGALNVALSPREIEFAYVANALGFSHWWKAARYRRLRRASLWPLTELRLAGRRRVDRRLGLNRA
jgi:hypothetical protein